MATTHTSVRTQGLGIAALAFGILGVLFSRWLPIGMSLSLAGLVLGVIGWFLTAPRASNFGLILGGLILSLAALALNIVIAGLNLDTFTFTALW